MSFRTKAEAIARVRQLQSQGVRSIDVGCLQINLMYHPDAFRDLDEAFDPLANARYAVDFLTSLKEKTGSWEQASAAYHSFNPELGSAYRGVSKRRWPRRQRQAARSVHCRRCHRRARCRRASAH